MSMHLPVSWPLALFWYSGVLAMVFYNRIRVLLLIIIAFYKLKPTYTHTHKHMCLQGVEPIFVQPLRHF